MCANYCCHKMGSAINSAGGRFRPLPATCDVLTRRSVDRRSTDEHELRQFPLPRPDAVVPVPQDALLWTYRVLSQSRWAGRPSSSARTAVCQLLHPVKGVLGYREAIRRQFPRSVAVSTQIHQRGRGWRVSASDIRFGWPPISNGGGLIYGFMVRYGSRQAHEHDAAGLNLLVDLDYLAAPTPSTGPQGGRH